MAFPSKKLALEFPDRLRQNSALLPAHVLGELSQVLVPQAGRRPAEGRAAILGWRDRSALIETSPAVLIAAADLAVNPFSLRD